jgi:hypothetical protein
MAGIMNDSLIRNTTSCCWYAIMSASLLSILLLGATCCEDCVLPIDGGDGPARYVGADACAACHQDLASTHFRHSHAQALKLIEGEAPTFPDVDATVGVPTPPAGFAWTDISYVIGGYVKAGNFVDANGFVLTDGTAGVQTQYNLAVPEINTSAGYASFMADQQAALPFEYECFRCHTTGAQTLAESGGLRQGNRQGIEGTWAEAGVQCERCHGAGSLHLPAPSSSTIEVDSTAEACADCHANSDDPLTMVTKGLFIKGNQQYGEVQASPHAGFSCTICHDPHASVEYDRDVAIRNECSACHSNVNMALHEGVEFVWDDYSETVSCESCHMPFAAKNSNSTEITLPLDIVVRFGDTRSHIMNINVQADSAQDMFTADLSEVATDQDGQASITTCYICQRCHHGLGNAFALTPENACALGANIHQLQP